MHKPNVVNRNNRVLYGLKKEVLTQANMNDLEGVIK